jgi:hypothetical protein
MLLVFFLALAPCYRLVLYVYRYHRIKQFKKKYDIWVTEELKDKCGNHESIYNYSDEITRLVRLSGNSNYTFSSIKDHIAIKNDATALRKAIGTFKHEVKRSFFPHTYLLMIINMPISLSKMLKITPGKALLLILYVAYTLLGILDVSLFVDKIANILG